MRIISVQDAIEFVQAWSAPGVSPDRRRRMLLLAAEGHRRNEAIAKSYSLLAEAALSASIAEYLEGEAGLLDVACAS